MRSRELREDLVEYFIAAFVWAIRDHDKFDEFWLCLRASEMSQGGLLARFSEDGRKLGLAVHRALQGPQGSAEYNAYDTVDRFVDQYIDHTLGNGGQLPGAKQVATMSRDSVALE